MKKDKTFKTLRDIRAIRPPVGTDARDTYHDALEPGLTLRVTNKDVRSWVFRRKKDGKSERVMLGHWPTTTLEQARVRAGETRTAFNKDRNPAEDRRQEKRIATSSVESVANEFLERHIDANTKWPQARRIMLADIVPPLGDRMIAEVSRADILRIVDTVVDRSSPVGANRVLAVAKVWLNWCVQRGYVPISVANGIKRPTKERSRDRVLTDPEMIEILTAAETMKYPVGPMIRVLAMLAQRKGEVAGMRWKDIDLDKKMWTLQSADTKAHRVHDVPLPDQVLAILQTLPRHKKGDAVFTQSDGNRGLLAFTRAKSDIDDAIADRRRKAGIKTDIVPWRMHDLRRTAATGMSAANVAPHVVSAILNHAPASMMGVTSIYNRFRYTDERRAALQAWSDHLDALMRTKSERSA